MAFKLKILTPEKTVFDAEVDSLVAPGADGGFGVLTDHAPMICGIGTGVLAADQVGSPLYFALQGGVAEIVRNEMIILADAARAEPDRASAEAALEQMAAAVPANPSAAEK